MERNEAVGRARPGYLSVVRAGWGKLTGAGLDPLLAGAARKRDGCWGKIITYSRKVFIPLTNMCRDTCGYCTFVKHPDSRSARVMTPNEVLATAEAGRRAGCKEALFSLGEKPEKRYERARDELAQLGYTRMTDYLRDMCELVLRKTGLIPHVNAGTLSREELKMLKPVSGSMGMMLENVSERLMEKGQAHFGCPDKHPAARLETLELAGELNVPFTTGLLIGIGETWEERIDTLFAIQDIHSRYGHIQEVIVQNFRAKPDIAMAASPEPELEEMLRTIAAARLILDDEIGVQAPPNLEEHYVRYIDAGLNDWGGISPVTIDHINPERAWPHISKLREVTRSAGYELRERLTAYPNYLRRAERYIDPAVRPAMQALAGKI